MNFQWRVEPKAMIINEFMAATVGAHLQHPCPVRHTWFHTWLRKWYTAWGWENLRYNRREPNVYEIDAINSLWSFAKYSQGDRWATTSTYELDAMREQVDVMMNSSFSSYHYFYLFCLRLFIFN